jgi:hypothetical protein
MWKCWDVENTKIYFPTPIGLVLKNTEKPLYLATVLGSLKYTIRRENRALSVRVAVVAQRDKEQCAEACGNHTRLTVLSVVIVR